MSDSGTEHNTPRNIQLLHQPSELRFVNDNSEPYDDTYSFISLEDLGSNISGNTMDKILLLRLLYYLKAPRGSENITLTTKYKGQGGNQNNHTGKYERMIFCMDPFNTNNNICAFLIGQGENADLFERNAASRDSKEYCCGKYFKRIYYVPFFIFTFFNSIEIAISFISFLFLSAPGSLFVIENPSMITKWMNNIPLITIPGSIIPVKSTLPLPPIHFVENKQDQAGFYEKGVIVTLDNLYIKSINCCGHLCGGLDMYKDGKQAPSCPCFSIEKHLGNVSGIFDMTLKFQASQEPRYIKHFTSKPFTNFFLRDEKMPMNVTGHSFQRREQRDMQKVVCSILQLVNRIMAKRSFSI